MDWLLSLLTGHTVASTLVVLGLAIGLGHALGGIRIAGISLGVAGVLFSSLLFGHLHWTGEPHVLEFIREFGLVLFVYCLGLQIGPGFFGSLKKQGLALNGLAACIVLGGVGLAVLYITVVGLPVPAGVGLLSGSVTNTPSLAAAQQALQTAGAGDEATAVQGLAYAVAYPFGIIGTILAMLTVRRIFRIDSHAETAALEQARAAARPALATRNLEVTNQNLAGLPLSRVPGLAASGVVVSRLLRGGEVIVPRAETTLAAGDVLHAVGAAEGLEALRVVVGREAAVDVKTAPGRVTNKRLIVTQSAVVGRPLASLTMLAQHDVIVTRVTRGGIEFPATADLKLQFGDVLMAVGEAGGIAAVSKAMGNSPKALDHPQMVTFFVGIALGVIAGSVPLMLPGVPVGVKLGLAGGPLVIALLLSRLGNVGRLVWYVPTNANLMLRELGISLFLAAVGLKSGQHLLEILAGGDGVRWLGLGAVITFVPLLVVGIVARAWKKLNYAELCGLLAGSMTDPPALAFAYQMTGSEAPAVSYATVYPMVMLLRVFSAQLIVALLYVAGGG